MKRPLVCTLVFLVMGIAAGRYMPGHVFAAFSFTAAAAALACAPLFYRLRRSGVFVYVFFTLAGFLLIRHGVAVKDPGLDELAARGATVTVQGVVKDAGLTKSEDRQKLTLRLRAYRADGEAAKRAAGVNLLVYLAEGERAACGQVIVLSGVPEPLRRARNPGGFDEYTYYKARGVEYKIMPASIVSEHGVANTPEIFMHNFRERLLAVYDAALPEREAGILRSMIVGDKSALDVEIAELYRMAGIYHILCVSGLHISIVALCLGKLFGLFLHPKASAALSLLFVVFYCLLTGGGVATARAAVMFGVLAGGTVLGRSRDLVTSASFAAFGLLVYQPLYLWDVGFQYSFTAVYGLAICTGPIARALERLSERGRMFRRLFGMSDVRNALAGCLAATLATTPVVAYHFYYVQPYSFIANMLVLPTVTVTTAAGFLAGLLGLMGPLGGEAAVMVAGVPFVLLKVYEAICRAFVSLPFSVILTGRPPLFAVLGMFALLGLFACNAGRAGESMARGRKFLLGASALYAVALFAHSAWPGPLRVAALDVGQGDCFVVNKGGAVFVIDGGGSAMREIGENTGVTVLKPYLDYMGVSRLSGVFATHSDIDHVAGVIEILGEKRVGTLFLSETADKEEELYQMLIEAARANGVPVATIGNGDAIRSAGLEFRCLYPSGGLINPSGNNTSLVLKLAFGGASFLFTGDVEAEGEADMLARGLDVSANVLKLAHHGSKYSSTPEFLERVAPKAAIVSASRTNRYGHPSPEVMELLAGMNVPVYSTAEDGAVVMETDGKSVWLAGR